MRGGGTPLVRGGSGVPPPEFFLKPMYLIISSHFEAHFSIFYNLNFKYGKTLKRLVLMFLTINFLFSCHPLGALIRLCVLLWHSLGRLNNFLKFFD